MAVDSLALLEIVKVVTGNLIKAGTVTMIDPDSVPDTPAYVVNIKWALEGLVMPAVGITGIAGKLRRENKSND